MELKQIGVVGAGAMGRGIAQVCAQAGIQVVLVDVDESVARAAQEAIHKSLDAEVSKGRLSQETADRARSVLQCSASLAGLAQCDLVIEAIVESLDAKRSVFKALEDVVSEECVLASNTSSLSITLLAAACQRPERLAGMHFFNPVTRMRLVEVIQGLRTDPKVVDLLEKVALYIGKEVVRVQDTPGFLVNQVGRGYTLEAVALVGEGVASFAEVDQVMRDAVGFRMGPFELLDLVGLDVNHPATEMIYAQFYHEPRYRPSSLMEMRVGAGALGRKTGGGYYEYHVKGDKPAAPGGSPVAAPAAPTGLPVWVSNDHPALGDKVRALLQDLGARVEVDERPSERALCVLTPVGRDASSVAAQQKLDPKRTVAIDALFGLDKHRTVMATCVTDDAYRQAAREVFAADGIPVTVVRDSPGFIAQRIVAMIMNIGGGLAQSRTATAADIDRAVTLGLAYPHGPLGFANALGPENTLRLLTGLYESFGDPRYRPSLWLKRRAALGIDFSLGD